VQTIVSDLSKVLPGLKIRDVWADFRKMIKHPKTFDGFQKELVGKKILKIRRRGKNILIDLSGNTTLLIHQKMTGHLLYGKYQKSIRQPADKYQKWIAIGRGPLKDDPQNRFLHLVISFSNGRRLALSDLRKFAKVLLWPTDKLDQLGDIKNIGPEPLEKSFTFEKFKKIFENHPAGQRRGKRGKVHQFLMEQKNIAGIGNIYSSEILWEAGIHPLKDISKLKETELKKIYQAVKKVLTKALKAKGDSTSDYRRPSGEKGGYQNIQQAYQMEGKKCRKNDGGIIQRIKIGSRSAFYCSKHQ